jgi:heme-degrading monooxygenase HmoA
LSTQLTTLSIFGLKKDAWRWALAQMGTAGKHLKEVSGLQFHKLLGTGKDEVFTLRPDWFQYAWLAVWEKPEDWESFRKSHFFWSEFQQHAQEVFTLELAPYKAYGLWDGKQPFTVQSVEDELPVAILTRASLRLRALPGFWNGAGPASTAVKSSPGLLAAVGMGEIPLLKQATFSVWESEEAMKTYAYRNALHQEVIRKTRQQQWYKEELFARFKVLKSEGTWHGRNPLLRQAPEKK